MQSHLRIFIRRNFCELPNKKPCHEQGLTIKKLSFILKKVFRGISVIPKMYHLPAIPVYLRDT